MRCGTMWNQEFVRHSHAHNAVLQAASHSQDSCSGLRRFCVDAVLHLGTFASLSFVSSNILVALHGSRIAIKISSLQPPTSSSAALP